MKNNEKIGICIFCREKVIIEEAYIISHNICKNKGGRLAHIGCAKNFVKEYTDKMYDYLILPIKNK